MLFKDSNNKNNRQLPTVTMLMLRVVVGVYLMYLAKSVYDSAFSPDNQRVLFLAFAVLFVAFGVVVIVMSVKDLLAGRYVGGAGDTSETDQENPDGDYVDEQSADISNDGKIINVEAEEIREVSDAEQV